MKNLKKFSFLALGLGVFGILGGTMSPSHVFAETQKIDISLSYANQSKYFGYIIPQENFVFSQQFYDDLQVYINNGYVGYTPLNQPMYTSYTMEQMLAPTSLGNSANSNAGTYDIDITLSQTALLLVQNETITDTNGDGYIDILDVVYDFNQISSFNLTLQKSTLTVVPQIVDVEVKDLSKTYLSALHDFENFDYYTVTQNKSEWDSGIYYNADAISPIGHLDLTVVNGLSNDAIEITSTQKVGSYYIVIKDTQNSQTFQSNYTFTFEHGTYEITQNNLFNIEIVDDLQFNNIVYGQTLSDIFDTTTPVEIKINTTISTGYDSDGNSISIANESYTSIITFLRWSADYETATKTSNEYIPGIYESAKTGLDLVFDGNNITFKVFGVNNEVANAILPEITNENYPEYTFEFAQKEVNFMPNIFVNTTDFDEVVEINDNSIFGTTNLNSFENLSSFYVKFKETVITPDLTFYELVPVSNGVNFATISNIDENYFEILDTANYKIDMKEYAQIFDEINTAIENLRTAVDNNLDIANLNLETVKDNLESLIQTEINNISVDIDDNSIKITELQNYYISLEQTTNTSLASINNNISLLASSLQNIQDPETQGSLANLIEKNVEDCASLSNSVTGFANQLSVIRMEISILAERIYALEADVGDTSFLKDQTIMSKLQTLETFASITKIVGIVLFAIIGGYVAFKFFEKKH